MQMWSRRGANFALVYINPKSAVTPDSHAETQTSTATSDSEYHLSEDLGSETCEHEACKDLTSTGSDEEPDINMFMDRRYSRLGNTFINADRVPGTDARKRSSSWSHPRTIVLSQAHDKSVFQKKDSVQDLVINPPQFKDSATTPRCRNAEQACESVKPVDLINDLHAMHSELIKLNVQTIKMMLQMQHASFSPSLPMQPLDDDRTTLVIRNLGNKLSGQQVMEMWPRTEGYDIFYVPFSFKKNKNLGFAFVNFRTHKAAVAFMDRWHGVVHPQKGQGIVIDWAKIQGFKAHADIINSYPDSLIKRMAWTPVVDYSQGLNHRDHCSF
eukprot:gnl/MRDRNA2_/MRDRNA2_83409_c0_seq1.p1 gnl/MRDRNA2_/MRDRNA2_83409_c0~~gnl/MRDRNA2_/MRDRNA2_83409_c0_seq1.p1  ORF type:complete len:327 (+),score=51.28 gnl/MRDRNA2_/MRDRNA2_83409_c0_seq1:108-1088(+)